MLHMKALLATIFSRRSGVVAALAQKHCAYYNSSLCPKRRLRSWSLLHHVTMQYHKELHENAVLGMLELRGKIQRTAEYSPGMPSDLPTFLLISEA